MQINMISSSGVSDVTPTSCIQKRASLLSISIFQLCTTSAQMSVLQHTTALQYTRTQMKHVRLLYRSTYVTHVS
jgi:hypothetical protein